MHPSKMAVPEEALLEDEHVEYRMAAGQAGVHHPLAPHRSLPNVATNPPRRRRAFLVRLSPWTRLAEEKCGCTPEALIGRAAEQGWPMWPSQPEGRYVWVPGNSDALAKGRALNRLLVCCKQGP